MKNPLTLAGIEPATFRFVAQHLNHYAIAVPFCFIIKNVNNFCVFFVLNSNCWKQTVILYITLVRQSGHTTALQFHGPATSWQQKQIHKTMKKLEFNSPPSYGRRCKYTDLWESLSSPTNLNAKILRFYAVTIIDLSMESSVNEGNATAQHFSVQILHIFMPTRATIINVLIPAQPNFNLIIFKCFNTVSSHCSDSNKLHITFQCDNTVPSKIAIISLWL